jgi:hypothetical protein
VASPNFKTGRYSRSIPGHLVATYERAIRDPKLLSLRDEIALTDIMIGDSLAQLDDDAKPSKNRRVFREVLRHIEQRRKLVDSEVRHLVLAREMMTAEEAMALLNALVTIVKRYVPDPKDQQAIAEETYALINSEGSIYDAYR